MLRWLAGNLDWVDRFLASMTSGNLPTGLLPLYADQGLSVIVSSGREDYLDRYGPKIFVTR